MRLFTGLKIPPRIADQLDALRGKLHGGRWIEREAYHITLSFIGEVEGRAIDEICQALATVKARPFTLQLRAMGCFGSSRPRALYAGVSPSDELTTLQGAQARAITNTGIELEKRKYRPHVTLARFKSKSRNDAGKFIARNNLFRSDEFEVSGFVLFSARPSGGGGPYAIEDEFAFTGQAGF
jgi:2'-5' RNA ligase